MLLLFLVRIAKYDHLFGKKSCSLVYCAVFRKRLLVSMCASFPFGF